MQKIRILCLNFDKSNKNFFDFFAKSAKIIKLITKKYFFRIIFDFRIQHPQFYKVYYNKK